MTRRVTHTTTSITLALILAVLPLAYPSAAVAEDDSGAGQQENSSSTGSSASESETATNETSESSASSEENSVNSGEEGTGGEQGESTESGDDGTTAGEESIASGDGESGPGGGDATVETGDGNSQADVVTESNTNETHTGTSSDTDILSENNGSADNDISIDTETGSSTALSGSGSATVKSGDAFSAANILNVINTNIVNSYGLLLLLNELLGGTVDLTSYFSLFMPGGSTSAATSTCTLIDCAGEGTTFTSNATSSATITNAVIVRSGTGENSAESAEGHASIQSGDAYAGANVYNVANSNFIDSNYLLVGINNLGDLVGDVLLPGKSFFETLLASGGGTGSGTTTVDNLNTANIENNVGSHADSGMNNATSTDGGAFVTTGDATAGASVTNIANTNLFGGKTVYFLFRVFGDWNGQVFGLPAGMEWLETENGVLLRYDGASGSSGQSGGALASAGENTIAHANAANIVNDVEVYALTGENEASGGTASIETGNAYAGANVVNIANTNVVGHNWILAIFNVFGNWKGNVAFGRPDLWIGATASSHSRIQPGSDVPFTFTISNMGNADATQAILNLTYDPSLISFENGGSWSLGTISAGTTREYSYTGHVSDLIEDGTTPIPIRATISALETDADATDNSEEITVVIETGSPGANIEMTPPAELVLTKIASEEEIVPPAVVDYTISVVNNGDGPAFHAELKDVLMSPDGTVMNEEFVKIGTIRSGEEVQFSYTIQFATSTPPGSYTNSAEVRSITRHPSLDPFYGTFANTDIDTEVN